LFDLDRYLARIGLDGRPGLDEVHRAHTSSIPFESLSAHVGEPVALDPGSLAAKLVEGGRGGYCFEQNLLLKAALETLGHEVEPYLARVLLGARPGEERGRTHLALRVDGAWHADAGFGGGTLIEPIPWGPGEEVEQSGWRYRIVEREGRYVLRGIEEGAWSDLYAFAPVPVPMIDIETSNWWVSTAPSSRFVSGYLVSRQWADGRRLLLTDWGRRELIERTPAATTRRAVAVEELPAVLAERFALPGFALDAGGRLALRGNACR
jgi:N-hydroxyarylamine O-acetyltransferase